MKRILLTGAMLLALGFSAKAQNIITSFEANESLGYTVGTDIGDYSEIWTTYNTETEGASEPGVITVSDDWASHGTQSLKLEGSGDMNNVANYVSTPPLEFTDLAGQTFGLGFDARTNSLSDDSAELYYNIYSINDEDVTPIAAIMFNYSGEIAVWDSTIEETEENSYGYQFVEMYEENTDYSLQTRFNADNSITYLLGGEQVYTFTPADTSVLNGVYIIEAGIDDFSSNWYLDNFTLTTPTAGVKVNMASQLSVYPNPASNIVTVAGTQGALVNTVSLSDINGRTVKTVEFSAVSQAQVSISDLASGVYMMTIASDKGTATKKIVKN